MNRKDRIRTFETSASQYLKQKKMAEDLEKKYPGIAEDRIGESDFQADLEGVYGRGDRELYSFLYENISFVDEILEKADNEISSECTDILRYLFIENHTQQETGDHFQMSRRQISVSLSGWYDILFDGEEGHGGSFAMSSDELAAFRNECGNYFFYMARVSEQIDKRRHLKMRMEGVNSIEFSRVISSNQTRMGSPVVQYLENKNENELMIEEYSRRIARILNTIDSIPDKGLRPAVWMLFVQKISYPDTAEMFGINAKTLRRQLNAQFLRTDEKQ